MKPSDFGVNGGWYGIRSTSALVNKFLVGDHLTFIYQKRKVKKHEILF